MEETLRQILGLQKDILNRLALLEQRAPESLVADLGILKRTIAEVPKLAGNPVTNSPTAIGYAPFLLNGKRVNLLIGS